MGLPWSRMDNTWYDHPKFLELIGTRALGPVALFWASVAYSSRHETGGMIPARALAVIHGSKKGADKLVFYGLWTPITTGWEIKNFADYQPTRMSAADRSDQASKASNARWHPDDEKGRRP